MTNAGRSNNAATAIYIGLGSNLGDREANLREAINRIEVLGLEIMRQSSVYETEPVGLREQPWFLNQVIEMMIHDDPISEHGPVRGNLDTIVTAQAEALLSELLRIELEMGRERVVPNGPRVIDIDLLLFGDMIIGHSNSDTAPLNESQEGSSVERARIVVPHPRMHLRRFVLEPLCEIAPDLVHPLQRKRFSEMLAGLDDASTVRLYKKGR